MRSLLYHAVRITVLTNTCSTTAFDMAVIHVIVRFKHLCFDSCPLQDGCQPPGDGVPVFLLVLGYFCYNPLFSCHMFFIRPIYFWNTANTVFEHTIYLDCNMFLYNVDITDFHNMRNLFFS